eukprot:GGOE01000912.1.p1 GENE.GGOE01000912.1~~GGOE01000912.1.p1  ORF type:complete len:641 (-),score=137.47 GGOE01000912.1:544-2412(-)
MATRVIVIGGGLAGVSAANTVVERGGRVLLLEKTAFLGGNSTKATSGINGALTRVQMAQGIPDSVAAFETDTALSAADGKPVPASPLAKVLTQQSAAAVDWLTDGFGLDLSLVSPLGGHSFPRTHRGKERFPGMTITYALVERLEELAKSSEGDVQIVTKAQVASLLFDKVGGAVVGVRYDHDGRSYEEHGPVIIATGGFAADFSETGLLRQVRPDLLTLPTTNGEHCTGDGIKMALAIGANTVDLSHVQVHPTGFVHPEEPTAKVKFLAAEVLRGVGGILLDANGRRFCDELGRRDYVTGEMGKHPAPFRLVLNRRAAEEAQWHCRHYEGRGLMRRYDGGAPLAADMGVAPAQLEATFLQYNAAAEAGRDSFGKKCFPNAPFSMNDALHVALVCPVVHYCMGGLEVLPSAQVVGGGVPIPGLWAAGEVVGGVHGQNRLGGNSLLDCVVFGRIAGDEAAKYLLRKALRPSPGGAARRLATIESHLQGGSSGPTSMVVQVQVDPQTNGVAVQLDWGGEAKHANVPPAPKAPAAPPAQSLPAVPREALPRFTLAEVAQHTTPDDCWVVVNGQVLDVSAFRKEHPGGSKVLLRYAGRDASEEFNLLHRPDVVAKYIGRAIVGTLA